MLLKRKKWNVEEFDKVNLPEVVDTISKEFGNFDPDNPTRILDMPIYMPDQGWRLSMVPSQFLEPIMKAAQAERMYGFEKDHYVYVTIDQKIVQEGKTGRRAGAHSDAYIEVNKEQIDLTAENKHHIENELGEVSHTYIVASNTPTEFFDCKFPLTDTSCDGSLKTFDEIANEHEPITFAPYTMLKMDPYVVHRCGIVEKTQPRTFMKVSFSKKKYSRTQNTRNHEFTYEWFVTPKSDNERNHPWT